MNPTFRPPGGLGPLSVLSDDYSKLTRYLSNLIYLSFILSTKVNVLKIKFLLQ